MKYNGRFIYVREQRPQLVTEIRVAGELLILLHEGKPVDNGVIRMITDVYGCLTSDDIRYITLITQGAESRVLSLIFWDGDEYEATRQLFRDTFRELTFSAQNNKINSYATSISEKQRIGVDVALFDTVIPDNMVECPVCGMLNEMNPAMPYCLDCGAALE